MENTNNIVTSEIPIQPIKTPITPTKKSKIFDSIIQIIIIFFIYNLIYFTLLLIAAFTHLGVKFESLGGLFGMFTIPVFTDTAEIIVGLIILIPVSIESFSFSKSSKGFAKYYPVLVYIFIFLIFIFYDYYSSFSPFAYKGGTIDGITGYLYSMMPFLMQGIIMSIGLFIGSLIYFLTSNNKKDF